MLLQYPATEKWGNLLGNLQKFSNVTFSRTALSEWATTSKPNWLTGNSNEGSNKPSRQISVTSEKCQKLTIYQKWKVKALEHRWGLLKCFFNSTLKQVFITGKNIVSIIPFFKVKLAFSVQHRKENMTNFLQAHLIANTTVITDTTALLIVIAYNKVWLHSVTYSFSR